MQLNQAIGSIEAIAKASNEFILESTDLSADKAETITGFYIDTKIYLGPKIIRQNIYIFNLDGSTEYSPKSYVHSKSKEDYKVFVMSCSLLAG